MNLISSDQELIESLIKISKNAGDAIMEIYESDIKVDIKSDQSPLTKADLISNKIICQSLREINPDIPILSEESSDIPYQERSEWGQYWLVDPLDGTKEFIKRNGEFTTNIALISDNRPILGVIHVPANQETFWGSNEIGAYQLKGESMINKKRIFASQEKRDNLRIVSSRSHPSGDLKKLLDILPTYKTVSIGSSLKFCLIAKGDADCYPRLGPTCEWDTAAGEIIAESAGASVLDIKNNKMQYNKRHGFLNPNFIVSSNINLTKELILTLERI
tara:strand:- start:75 stop:899 length:825 start_codon:yes stop_codon:yes gene_type:complete